MVSVPQLHPSWSDGLGGGQRVLQPALPLDSILNDDVITGPAVEDVQPRPAEQNVVTRAAKQHIVARAADQHVVPITSVRGEQDGVGGQARSLHNVVTAQRMEDQPIIVPFGAGDVHLGGQAKHGDAGGIDGVTPLKLAL
jgi:hypothetical protein